MADVRDFKSLEGGKREPCLYCGQAQHVTPLACPRIAMIHLNDDACISGISFHDDWNPSDDEPPKDAA